MGLFFKLNVPYRCSALFSKEKKDSLDQGLQKSKEGFFTRLSKAVAGKSKVDDEVLDNLEEILVSSDVGIETTLKIINRIRIALPATSISTQPSSTASSKKK